MERLRAAFHKIVTAVQKVLMPVMLTLVYVFGFGATLVLVLLFDRKLLGVEKASASPCWKDAAGYEATLEDAVRQS